MTALSGTKAQTPPKPVGHVNDWRGRCLNSFSSVERSVATALLLMKGDKRWPAKDKLPHFTGAKLELLAKLIAANGKFAAIGQDCRGPLSEWIELESDRVWVVHGDLTLALCDDSGWQMIATWVDFRDDRGRIHSAALPVTSLKHVRDRLEKAAAILTGELTAFCATLAGGPEKVDQLLYNASSRAP